MTKKIDNYSAEGASKPGRSRPQPVAKANADIRGQGDAGIPSSVVNVSGDIYIHPWNRPPEGHGRDSSGRPFGRVASDTLPPGTFSRSNPNQFSPVDVSQIQERPGTEYGRVIASNDRRRGPARFEEGIGRQPAVPAEMLRGVADGYTTANHYGHHRVPGTPSEGVRTSAMGQGNRQNHWSDDETYIGSFAAGTSPEAERRYLYIESGRGGRRRNESQVTD